MVIYPVPLFVGYIIFMLVLFLILIPIDTYVNHWISRFNAIWKSLRKNIQLLHDDIRFWIQKTQDFDEILSRSRSCFRLLQQIKFLYSFRYIFFSRDSYGFLSTVLEQIPIFILSILSDLRTDLEIRMAQQQKIIESTQSELTKNFSKDPKLVLISELQKTRLDHQIHQFETIQKILVKI